MYKKSIRNAMDIKHESFDVQFVLVSYFFIKQIPDYKEEMPQF